MFFLNIIICMHFQMDFGWSQTLRQAFWVAFDVLGLGMY